MGYKIEIHDLAYGRWHHVSVRDDDAEASDLLDAFLGLLVTHGFTQESVDDAVSKAASNLQGD